MKTTSSSAAWQTVERIRDSNGNKLTRIDFMIWFAIIYFLMKTVLEADDETDEEEWASGGKGGWSDFATLCFFAPWTFRSWIS
jgi:hypothetical protein